MTESVGTNGVSKSIDHALERVVVSCLLYRPELIAIADPKFDLDVVADWHAQKVLTAIVNMREKHGVAAINPRSIAKHLTDGGDVIDPWYGRLVDMAPDPIDPMLFVERTRSLVRLAAKRAHLIDETGEPARIEAEIDEVALRDAEPAPSVPPPDPWKEQLAKARAEIDSALGKTRKKQRLPLFGMDMNDLMHADLPTIPWQISGLVTKGGTTVVAGEPKAGIKTWVLLEGALAIATGTKMFGQFYAEQGTVAIFFAEDQAQSIRNRTRALIAGAEHRSLAPGRLFLQPRGEFIDLLNDEDLAWIIASCRRLPKLDLLILDPLRDVHSAAEDKSDEMSPVMRRLRLLGELLSCTVWVSHHTPKATKDTAKRRVGQNMRGSSAIHGSIDNGIYIEPKDGDGVSVFGASIISQIKAGRSAGAFDLELSITDDDNGEAIRASWVYAKESGNGEDELVLAWISEMGEKCTQTQLRAHKDRPKTDNGKPIPERRMIGILKRLQDTKKLRSAAGLLVPTNDRMNGARNDLVDSESSASILHGPEMDLNI